MQIPSFAVTLLWAVAPGAGAVQDINKHYFFAGPMVKFMVEGAVPAPVTTGLPFSIVLTDNGASVSPPSFDLKAPDWPASAKLTLEGLKFAGGHLTGAASLRNGSGLPLEGLRVDIVGATEEYKDKDDQGKEVLKARAQAVSIPSPLLFGDLAKDESADGGGLDVSAITFRPETTRVTVNGVVSGLAFLKRYNVGPQTKYEIGVDSKGRIYTTGGDNVVRIDADGANKVVVVKGDPDCHGVAIDPSNDDILVNSGNDHIVRYSPGGDEKSRLTVEKSGIDLPTEGVRVDRMGRIYNAGDNQRNVQCIEGGKKIWTVPLESEDLFEVDADQNLYTCADHAVTVYDKDGKKVKRLTFGPDWHIGRVIAPRSLRSDKQGNLFVLDRGQGPDGDEKNAEAERITVFSRDGKVVRVFGRGSKSNHGDDLMDGQIYGSQDLAFSPDNHRLYVFDAHRDNDSYVEVFAPF